MTDEKIFVINLRRNVIKKPRWFRSSLATKLLRKELEKRTKAKVKIDKKLNEAFWKRTVAKTITKVKVKITKIDEKTVKAELVAK